MLIGPSVRWWHTYTSQEVQLFRSLVIRVEREINNSVNDIQNNITSLTYNENDPKRSPFTVRHIDGLHDVDWDLDDVLQKHFPNIQRSAYVITLFSFLEDSLIELCNLYHEEKHLKVQYKDINGQGISRCRKYLDKVVDLNFSKINNSWENISNLNKIRNIIVHRNRLVDLGETSTVNFIKNNKHLELNNSEIIIREGFLMSMLVNIEEFITDIDGLIAQQTKE